MVSEQTDNAKSEFRSWFICMRGWLDNRLEKITFARMGGRVLGIDRDPVSGLCLAADGNNKLTLIDPSSAIKAHNDHEKAPSRLAHRRTVSLFYFCL